MKKVIRLQNCRKTPGERMDTFSNVVLSIRNTSFQTDFMTQRETPPEQVLCSRITRDYFPHKVFI